MSFDAEGVAKAAVSVAAQVVSSFSPLGGIVLAWAGSVAFDIYDLEKQGQGGVEAAQLAGDRVADLCESLKLGSR